MPEFIVPDWPAPPRIRAYTTTRQGGCSQPPYASFNLADHVGDDPNAVSANRKLLRQKLNLPAEPLWLTQVHGTHTVVAEKTITPYCSADASYTTEFNRVCVVLTADCLPVLFCDREGTQIAIAHAGWRGLAAGVLESTLAHFNTPPPNILAWLGPAIGATAFEVGNEVREAFIHYLPHVIQAFKAHGTGHWWADLYLLARQRLNHYGVTAIYGGNFCTYTHAEHFYSYRRDKMTGRMASLLWMADR